MMRRSLGLLVILAAVALVPGCSADAHPRVAPDTADELTASLRTRYGLSEIQAGCASKYLVSALDGEIVAKLVSEGFDGLPLEDRFYVSENILPCLLWADPDRRPTP